MKEDLYSFLVSIIGLPLSRGIQGEIWYDERSFLQAA